MGTSSSRPFPFQCNQNLRFTTREYLCDLSLSLTGNIAVSGYTKNGSTFIDLYSGGNANAAGNLLYSIEFEKDLTHPLKRRYVSFLGTDFEPLVTCNLHKIYTINTSGRVLQSHSVSGGISCLSVRERSIFVGLKDFMKLIVFNSDLQETRIITLDANTDVHLHIAVDISSDPFFKCYGKKLASEPVKDYFRDVAVLNDRLLVCKGYCSIGNDGALSYRNTFPPTILTVYTERYSFFRAAYKMYSTRVPSRARSIAASERFGLVVVVWERNKIDIYHINNDEPFVSFDVDFDIDKIRISESSTVMVAANYWTSEIQIFDLRNMITYDHMKDYLVSKLSEISECEELVNHFHLNADDSRLILNNENHSQVLLDILEVRHLMRPLNVTRIASALHDINLSCYHAVDIYRKTQANLEAITYWQRVRNRRPENNYRAERTNISTYDRLKDYLVSKLSRCDCAYLVHHFQLNEVDSFYILTSEKPSEALFRTLEVEGLIRSSNVNRLANALHEMNSSCYFSINTYRNTHGLI